MNILGKEHDSRQAGTALEQQLGAYLLISKEEAERELVC